MKYNLLDFPEETTALFDSDLQAEKRAHQLAILALNKRIDLLTEKTEKLIAMMPMLKTYNKKENLK